MLGSKIRTRILWIIVEVLRSAVNCPTNLTVYKVKQEQWPIPNRYNRDSAIVYNDMLKLLIVKPGMCNICYKKKHLELGV